MLTNRDTFRVPVWLSWKDHLLFESLSAGLSLGLATGLSCLASCGPIYGVYLLEEKRTGLQALYVLLKLNAGRFIAYAIFGALIGQLGGVIPVSVRTPLVLSGYILFSIYLLLSVIRIRKTCSGCQTGKLLKITKSAFLLGFLTGFSICPAFLIAVTSAFNTSGPISGMMLFIGFFAGTTAYMLPFAVFGLLTMKDWVTKAARVVAVIVAIYFGSMGIRGLVQWISQSSMRQELSEMVVHDAHGDSDISIFSVENSDTLYILTFAEDEQDRGVELAEQISDANLPPLKVILSDKDHWLQQISSIPELSPVLTPKWIDSRSGVETSPWQDSIKAYLESMRMRTFAVEYEPWCTERGFGIQSFLEMYAFRCHPDSGFTFLMLNPLGCGPADCSSCDITH